MFICSVLFTLILEKVFQSCGVSHSHWVEEDKDKDKNKVEPENNKVENQNHMEETKKTKGMEESKNNLAPLNSNEEEN